jgi:hypothetical protein
LDSGSEAGKTEKNLENTLKDNGNIVARLLISIKKQTANLSVIYEIAGRMVSV